MAVPASAPEPESESREPESDPRSDAEERERRETREAAAEALRAEVVRQAGAGTPLLARTDAEPFLMDRGLSRTAARDLIADGDGVLWAVVSLDTDRERPPALLPVSHNGTGHHRGGSG